MMIPMGQVGADPLCDNILYFIGGYFVKSPLPNQQCKNCRAELLFDPNDPLAQKTDLYPSCSQFSLVLECWKIKNLLHLRRLLTYRFSQL